MARGLNKVMIIGTLGHDPEMRYTPSGKSVTSFSLAANRTWVTAEGEYHNETEWFNVVAWGNLAEICNQYLNKGSKVYVEGRLQTRSWEDQNGQKHYRTEVVATEMIILDERERAGDEGFKFDGGPTTDNPTSCLNKVMIIGNLGRGPEMRYTTGGRPVTSFSLAASRTWVTAEGERRDETEWFSVVTWGNLAEVCNRYLSKGEKIFIEGRLQTRSWEDHNGQKHFRTEVTATEMILLNHWGRNNGRSESQGGDFYESTY
jgi:single-strand DNA-binding protein